MTVAAMQVSERKFRGSGRSALRHGGSFQAAEHALDGVTVAIEEGREAVLPFAIHLRWKVRHNPTLFNLAAYGVGVEALVNVQDVALGKLFKQLGACGAICDLATSEPLVPPDRLRASR